MAVYPIRNMYLEAIDRASERIWMTQGYLIPDDDVVAALHQAASRGVDVRIVIPAESNHVIADWLSRGYYDRLLHQGVRLFLYQELWSTRRPALLTAFGRRLVQRTLTGYPSKVTMR